RGGGDGAVRGRAAGAVPFRHVAALAAPAPGADDGAPGVGGARRRRRGVGAAPRAIAPSPAGGDGDLSAVAAPARRLAVRRASATGGPLRPPGSAGRGGRMTAPDLSPDLSVVIV